MAPALLHVMSPLMSVTVDWAGRDSQLQLGTCDMSDGTVLSEGNVSLGK